MPPPPAGYVSTPPPDFGVITTDSSMWEQLIGRNVMTNLLTSGLDSAVLLRQATESFLLFEYQDGNRARQLAWSRDYVKSVEFITGHYEYPIKYLNVPAHRILYHGCIWLDHNQSTTVPQQKGGSGLGVGFLLPLDGAE